MGNSVLSRLAVVLLVALFAASADAGRPAGAMPPGGGTQGFEAEIAYFDMNGNGTIDPREFASRWQTLSTLQTFAWEDWDRNRDGQVSATEFRMKASQVFGETFGQNDKADVEAEAALANAVPFNFILRQLRTDAYYAQEVTSLSQAVQNSNQDATLISHVVANPLRYPRLAPIVRLWAKHSPYRETLSRNFAPLPPHAQNARAAVKQNPPPGWARTAAHQVRQNKQVPQPQPKFNANRPFGTSKQTVGKQRGQR